MPVTIEVEELDEVLRDLQKVRRDWPKLVAPTVAAQAQKTVQRIKQRRLSGRPGLIPRTGALRRAVAAKTTTNPTEVLARIGLLKPGGKRGGVGDVLTYGRIHEFGGTIRPKRAKYLTIPLKDARTKAGVPKFTAREAARVFSAGTFIAKSKKGNLIIFGKLGLTKTGRQRTRKLGETRVSFVPLFVLKKRVTIPKRPWLRPEIPIFLLAVQKLMQRKLADVMEGKK